MKSTVFERSLKALVRETFPWYKLANWKVTLNTPADAIRTLVIEADLTLRLPQGKAGKRTSARKRKAVKP
jgi:hypothetical protein